MKKFLKWTGFVVAAFGVVVLIGIGFVYFASERELARHHDVAALPALTVPTDAASIAEGRHIARDSVRTRFAGVMRRLLAAA